MLISERNDTPYKTLLYINQLYGFSVIIIQSNFAIYEINYKQSPLNLVKHKKCAGVVRIKKYFKIILF